jgi:hypothetical protein
VPMTQQTDRRVSTLRTRTGDSLAQTQLHAHDPDERAHGDRVDVIAIMGSWQSVLLN